IAATLIARRDRHRASSRTDAALDLLGRAARESLEVEIEFVAADGTPARTTAMPTAISAGAVRLSSGGAQHSLPLARITAVRLTG
ncbi:MAG TPA: hypothetical protein GXZ30_01805, partial [Propionibacterium sp.]|nr:hypothetical protein [Propionibacterium sp.]